MHTRRLCTLAFLALLPLAAFAQGRVRYTYDEAGNRVKREAVLSVQKSMDYKELWQKLWGGVVLLII